MMTVHEVSQIAGVSIRALHHYDRIGLLSPAKVTDAGYRLYDEKALARLQQILIFKALDIPLSDIRRILDDPAIDRDQILQTQIELLTLKKEHLEDLLSLARDMKKTGVKLMSFDAFDTRKIDEYARQAKENWGATPAYREYEKKTAGRSKEEMRLSGNALMAVIGRFTGMMDRPADDPDVQAQVRALQAFITEHYYTCTDEILLGLGQMYAAGGEMTRNIDGTCGDGTAEFVSRAIACAVSR